MVLLIQSNLGQLLRSLSYRATSPLALQRTAHQGNALPVPPRISCLESPSDAAEARSWLSRFQAQSIPRDAVDLSFSRSSGPGGQNVNKVNTKATLRCAVDSQWIPVWARPELTKSPFYVASTQSVLITSTLHRSQSQNVDDCLSKLHQLILTASSASVKKEPSEEQKKRIANLERGEQIRRRREKSKRSAVKKGRAYKSMRD